jgi:sugar phosphate isomerase/epimerase
MEHCRRQFIKSCGILLLGSFSGGNPFAGGGKGRIEVDAHLWVYASRFPPDWDCTSILSQIFMDLKEAGYDGVEIMESILRHDGAVVLLSELIEKHEFPVKGTSYYGNMWKAEEHQKILDDIGQVLEKLHKVGGSKIGLTVGDAGRIKTEKELDDQANLLNQIIKLCKKYEVQPNLHNHTFEVINNLHDLKGTLARIPDIKLGPDLNWLVRGGIDPVWFIKTYGKQMVYMHIRDQDANGQWTEAVGEGVTNFPQIAQALKEMNYQGNAAVELAFDKPPSRTIKEDWKISRAYVNNIFGW